MKKQIERKLSGRRKGKLFLPKYTIGQGKGTHEIVRTKQAKGG